MTRPIEKISIVLKFCKAVTQSLYDTDIAITVLWCLGGMYHVVWEYHQIIMVPIVIARVSYSSNNTDSIGTNGTSSINLSALQRY